MKFSKNAIYFLLCYVYAITHGYQLLTDETNGGNPKLDTKIYTVYIQTDPSGNSRENEIKEAVNKWKTALGQQGVTLEIQTGNPPETPVDLKSLNEDIEKFNNDPNPDISKYPELQKSENKKCTISFYFETTAEIINRRGGGSKRGFANSIWDLDADGKAGKTLSSDVFIATDPPGADETIKK